MLYWLDRIQSSDRTSIGEKAFALGQLKQQGYPVLPAFAIAATVFREFIKKLGSRASILTDFPDYSLHLDVNNYSTLQQAAQQSRLEIIEATLPDEWRSQFFAAAQQLQSPYLNLGVSLSLPVPSEHQFAGLLPDRVCWCDSQSLERSIEHIWAQLLSAKSLFYWRRMGIGIERVGLAILVQPIGNAIASGRAEFGSDSLQIQSNFGLGQSIFAGESNPDLHQIQLSTGQIVKRQLGNKIRAYRLKSMPAERDCLEPYELSSDEQERYCLDEPALAQLIKVGQRLSSEQLAFRSFEWTILQNNSQLYITQANAALPQPTTATNPSDSPVIDDSQPLIAGLPASPGRVTALACAIAGDIDPAAFPSGRILIAPKILPHWLPWLKQAAGIVVEQGGMTSHAAIIARELGIPAIVDATNATQLIQTGESVLLDGSKGKVYRWQGDIEDREKKTGLSTKEWGFYDPIATRLMVNLSQPTAIAKTAALPVDGIGLLRSEWAIASMLSQKPIEKWLETSERSLLVEQLARGIDEFAKGFAPRPVYYRSLDLHKDEGRAIEQRGTYGYQLDPTLFDLELQALSQVAASGRTNVNLILPFVRGVEEFSFCRDRVERAGLFKQPTFQLWIMVEVPSAIFLLPQLVRSGVGGIAIGTNDLTQLLLGVDRERAMFSDRLNARHPAVLAAIEQIVRTAKTANIPCSICGQAPVQYPELVERLVEWGITSISVEPEAVEATYRAIARAERRILLEAIRNRNLSKS